MKSKLLKVLLVFWIVIVGIAYYIILPPINPTSIEFWVFFIPAVFAPLYIIVQLKSFKGGLKQGRAFYPTAILIIMVAIYVIGCVVFFYKHVRDILSHLLMLFPSPFGVFLL